MRIRLASLILLLGLLIPWHAAAQDRALHWERYDYDIRVLPNGDLRFTETQVLAIDRGTFSFGTLSFDTGEYGLVRNVAVAEDGEPYVRGTDQPGTFVASDDGNRFQLRYVFSDPNARRHTMTIGYTVARALVAEGGQADLTWNFFCGAEGCPAIEAGAITVRFPQDVDPASLQVRAAGAPVRQTATGGAPRWELTEPIQATQVRLGVTFPRQVLAPEATFRSGEGAPAAGLPVVPQPQVQPLPAPANPVPVGLPISPLFCFIMIFVLLFFFSSARRSSHRGGYAPRRGPQFPGPFGGMGMPGMPGRRRRGGRRGYGGGGYGGWGIPPIIIAPPSRRHDDYGGPFAAPPDNSSGGGGSAWGDSGGGGSSWGDSGGGGSSWSDAAGGGSSWGDSGGGGGSWGGSGGGGGDSGGGGGNNNSSSFG